MQRLESVSLRRSMLVLHIVLMVFALLLGTGQVQAQAYDLPQQPYLPLDLSFYAASAALAQCQADGFRVSVALVDSSGVLKVLLRDDGARTVSISSATRKAYTAANFGRSTEELAATVAENPGLEGLRQIDPQVLILGGGLPIVVNDAVVGGIGVGGAPAGSLDEVCAQAGVDAVYTALEHDEEDGTAGDATPTPEAEPEVEATVTPSP